MSELTLKPDPDAILTGDKQMAVPMLALELHRRGELRARRRFSTTRLAPPPDDGFRLFRVY